MSENLKSFLVELAEVSKKYNFFIGGCGCCGSPYLVNDIDDGFEYENLIYDYRKEVYTITINEVPKGKKKGCH